LISATVLRENTTVVYLRRLAPQKQARLAELMDKNNNRQLRRTMKSLNSSNSVLKLAKCCWTILRPWHTPGVRSFLMSKGARLKAVCVRA